MKCANCSNQAAYVYEPTAGHIIPYCIADIPSFLKPQLKAGYLKKAEGFDDFLTEAIATVTESVKETEPVVEPVIEEEPVVKKAPAKKTSKKASDVHADAE
jgi:hypothetical protein